MTKSLNKIAKKVKWSSEMDAEMNRLYPEITAAQVALLLKVSVDAIYVRAGTLGLKKSENFKSSPAACRLRRGDNVGAKSRFSKGHSPFNKGVTGWSAPGTEATRFKPGSKPFNYLPVGSTRKTKDGYLQIKMTDTGYPPKDWRGLHVVIWERMHGCPIPSTHILTFRNANKECISIANMALVSRVDHMKKYTLHNYPEEIFDLIHIKGRLTQQINRKKTV